MSTSSPTNCDFPARQLFLECGTSWLAQLNSQGGVTSLHSCLLRNGIHCLQEQGPALASLTDTSLCDIRKV